MPYGIQVFAYTDGRPVWERSAEECRYTCKAENALPFATEGEAETYAEREIRRFGLEAQVRQLPA